MSDTPARASEVTKAAATWYMDMVSLSRGIITHAMGLANVCSSVSISNVVMRADLFKKHDICKEEGYDAYSRLRTVMCLKEFRCVTSSTSISFNTMNTILQPHKP
jgi:hypothetical protein